jgi:hypothetical protein
LPQAGTILLRESRITASAQAGQGGRIDIVAEVFLADPDSVIDASSQLGIDGEVNIEAVVSNLSEVVEPLSPRLASETALLRDLCATRLQQGLVSSFVERGRAGIPSAPDGLLPSRLDMSDAETAGSGESLPHGMAMAGEPSWRLGTIRMGPAIRSQNGLASRSTGGGAPRYLSARSGPIGRSGATFSRNLSPISARMYRPVSSSDPLARTSYPCSY